MTSQKYKHLMICGFPSGGTDLTKSILNAHPNIDLCGELPLLTTIKNNGYFAETTFSNLADIEKLRETLKNIDVWKNLKNIDYNFSEDLKDAKELSLEEVIRKLSSNHADTLIWGNKTPQNTEKMLEIQALFPDVYFLIVTRDVREICLSWKNKWGRNSLTCANRWNARMSRGWKISKQLDAKRILFIKFEDLLNETEQSSRKICRFLSLPFSPRMLEHYKYIDANIDGKINYGQPIKRGNFEKWRDHLSLKKIKRIEEIAWDSMQLLGYSPKYSTNSKPISKLEKFLGYIHDAYAFIAIGNRAKSNNSFLSRLSATGIEIKKQIISRSR